MKKLVSVLIGALALAAIAPVLALALLHGVGGTAQADAPPATFWKVSIPDLGQHSDAWCWAGAASDAFWWSANNAGQTGLLGGVGFPWENIDPGSLAPGAACGVGLNWRDVRDAGDGAAILGYPTVLRRMAEATFTDNNQNGVKDTLAGEINYCYGQGVEEWDYLIGLRDYVKNNGSNLTVNDIINPVKCTPGNYGLKVNRSVPSNNTLDPCGPGAAAPGGVPGVNQVGGGPTMTDYETQVSTTNQDVLLWLERNTSPTPETAHVVAGVGYNDVGGTLGFGTITVSDPWTHATNPPLPPIASASHTDNLPGPPGSSWQSKPDHNTSGAHGALPATEPYNLCDVTSRAPLAIRCYDEDNGTFVPWTVTDLIYLAPIPSTDTPTPTSTATNTPTITPTRTPTGTPRPVGGVAEAPDVSSGASGGSSAPYAVIGGTIAGVLLLGAAGWYARRRWLT